MKPIKNCSLYNVDEIADMLEIKRISVISLLSKSKIKKHKTIGRTALYTEDQVNIIRNKRRLSDISYETLLEKNYKVKPIIITYYIYESKMNKDE
jgi:hypothetical protein